MDISINQVCKSMYIFLIYSLCLLINTIFKIYDNVVIMLSLDRGQLRHWHFLRCHVKYYSPIGCSIDCCLILTILVILCLITSVIQLGNHDETKLRISFKYFSEMDTNNEKISGDDNVEIKLYYLSYTRELWLVLQNMVTCYDLFLTFLKF